MTDEVTWASIGRRLRDASLAKSLALRPEEARVLIVVADALDPPTRDVTDQHSPFLFKDMPVGGGDIVG